IDRPARTRWRSGGGVEHGWRVAGPGHRDLFLLPSVVTGAVRSVAERAGDSWTGGTKALGSALKGGGFLALVDGARAADRNAATVRPRIGGVQRDVWQLVAQRYEIAGGVDYASTDYSGAIGIFRTRSGP
ncbi:hypothetical protein QTQ03_28975, partial [Micromonospora sp. WMMA1363]|uniref:hypothetical protein n=1 Tax=Micromonospora sp. WMMA1363 TaxID=3053985 RepID=UPI00259C9172